MSQDHRDYVVPERSSDLLEKERSRKVHGISRSSTVLDFSEAPGLQQHFNKRYKNILHSFHILTH